MSDHASTASSRLFFAPLAWVRGAWVKDVLLAADTNGLWDRVTAGVDPADHPHARVLTGPVLPGVVNAHSHAFQRAIVGLTERRNATGTGAADNFWSWRDRMYSAANRITPDQLEAVAGQLYAELLVGGYTQVCEFQYLHNDIGGRPYADPVEMSLALVRAAQRTGIGLTVLPTLYMRAGFSATTLREDQRRFASTPDSVMRIVEAVTRRGGDAVNAGVAMHSLRAADEGALRELSAAARALSLPVHIHIAEQTQEVDDCITQTGQRPIEWLLDHLDVDARWNLVHATHATPAELGGVSARSAAIVLCPSTEANLGDGIFDLPAFAAAGGRWSVGSDSHVTRSWPEELRLLEYSQRLSLRQRNVSAGIHGRDSTAAALFESALAGGASAMGGGACGLAVGERADFVTLDRNAPALLGIPDDYLLDALVFSSPEAGFASTHVAGRCVSSREAPPHGLTGPAFRTAMQQLWDGAWFSKKTRAAP